ncbi:MAG TPA: hypothetical protein VIJ68_03650 [Candidatus Saccharimonadales bacterium]
MSEQIYSQAAEEALYAQLRAIAEPHVERSDGQLSILKHNLEKYPAQALGVFVVAGNVAPPANTDYIGKKAMPDFVAMSYELVDGDVGEASVRREAEEILRARQNIDIDTDHDDVTSPAYPLCGFTNTLRKGNAYLPREEWIQFESGIIVSKMLSVLAYEVDGEAIPCMYVLQMLCDRVYLTYPRTKTFMRPDLIEALPPNHIDDHNRDAKEDIGYWLDQGRVVLGESLLASTHRLQEDGQVSELSRVTKGSAEMVTRDDVHVLPVIVGLTEEERYMQRIGGFQQFSNWEDAHPLSEEMATARTERNRARGSQVVCVYQAAEQAKAEKQARRQPR